MLTTITATMIRDARMQGDEALRKVLSQLPSVETASTDEVSAFISAMERIPA